MLDELGPWLTKAKVHDLLGRLDRDDPDQAIPAEYELALSWALSRLTEVEVEPKIGGKTPDILAPTLFPDQPAVIEVTAMSDDALSGESIMRRTANITNAFANTVRKGASKNLHYEFLESSGYEPVPYVGGWTRSRYFRRRLASRSFELTATMKDHVRSWLQTWPNHTPLRIRDDKTDVIVTWREFVHPESNCFSSMPSEVHDVVENPIYARLKEKERDQLRVVPAGTLRCIFLCDAGCRLLREPNGRDPTNRVVSGAQIVTEFLMNSSVDIVCILSPRRRLENSSYRFDHNPRLWHLFVFDKWKRPKGFHDKLHEVIGKLPQPYLHGYQARSWLRQGMLRPQGRGQYLGMTVTSHRGSRMTAKISSRALLELMAGRLDADKFETFVMGDRNLFDHWLNLGYSISNVRFESSEADNDDDYVVFELDSDPNASALRAPSHTLDSLPGTPEQEIQTTSAGRAPVHMWRWFASLFAKKSN